MTLLRPRIGTSINEAEGRETSPMGITSSGMVKGSSRRVSSAPCAMMRRAMPLGSSPWPATSITNRRPLRSVSTFRTG